MDDDNLFDEDDALDYILYEDAENQDPKDTEKTGCLGVILLPVITTTILYLI